jgi:2-methylcitrate dehydratase PrpD
VSGSAHHTALLDWMACAIGGREERAVQAVPVDEPIARWGTAGHVLDFDDTYLPGIAHLSAAVAPAAIVTGAETGADAGDVLRAYAGGMEAMGRFARASHPGLYDNGWHPTAVCGGVGAAAAVAFLFGLDEDRVGHALRLALTGSGGLISAFGSDAKSLQVGAAAAHGARAARVAARDATASEAIVEGFERATGATFPRQETGDPPAITENWIKPWPCCLMAHGAIEAVLQSGSGEDEGPLAVVVSPVAQRAASHGPAVRTGLEAKFSIPYLVALTLTSGEPRVADFAQVDDEVVARARTVTVGTDPSLGDAETVLLDRDGEELARVSASRGSPEAPLSAEALQRKVAELAGDRLDGILDDPAAPATVLLEALSR